MIENLDEIKAQLAPVDVLKAIGYPGSSPIMTGTEIRDYCPIHGSDKNRSLSINTATKLWLCHACRENGDLFKLYMKAKNIEFEPAVKVLASLAGIEIRYTPASKTSLAKNSRSPQQVLSESSTKGESQYLKTKLVETCEGLYFGKDNLGNPSLIVPLRDIEGTLQTVQFVRGPEKHFLGGYPAKGAFFCTSKFEEGDTVYLAEGIATALTIWKAFDKAAPVISFGSAFNMASVVCALKQKYPNLKIVVCLDNDKGGLKLPSSAVNNFVHSYRLPVFEGMSFDRNSDKAPKDFNDLLSKCGQEIDVINKQLMIEHSFEKLSARDEVAPLAEEDPKATDSSTPFSEECQEEILSYLFAYSLEKVMEDGLAPESFDPRIFTGDYKVIMQGVIKTWEQGFDVNVTQIAINAKSEAKDFFGLLMRIEDRPPIAAEQVTERILKLRKEYETKNFKTLLSNAQRSSQPLSETLSILRSGIDTIYETSNILQPQSYDLHLLVEEIKNPKSSPIPTGLRSFDILMGGGFIKGELGMLAGGAGSGKTAFALQVACEVAKSGTPVIYVSIEIGRRKLTERILKRLSYQKNGKGGINFDQAAPAYQEFSNNLYLVKGHHGMQVSELRGMALSVMRKCGKDVLLIVDPFQRLGTGNEKIDLTNETLKVGTLCSQLKELAESLDIPVLALSDTVKSHKENKSGEGSIRGTYMADHTADYVMRLRTSKDAFEALYGIKQAANTSTGRPAEAESDDPFLEEIKAALADNDYKNKTHLDGNPWNKYASLTTSKVRDNGIFNPLFVYRPASHLFEETTLWYGIHPDFPNEAKDEKKGHKN